MTSIQNASTDESDSHPVPVSASSSSSVSGKKQMSMFSFVAPKPSSANGPSVPAISTSPGQTCSMKFGMSALKSPSSAKSPCSAKSPSMQLSSPVCSPVLETDSLTECPDCNIFERSVQETAPVKQEDYIPPALDATTEILSDKDTNLDDVEMIYSSRRNLSVIGLNMALRRPYTPLRKNSVQSMSQMNAVLGCNGNGNSSQQPQSPVSPPKLSTSRSSVSFYSYADMINNDEFARRPSVMHSYSHGVVPTLGSSVNRKMSVTLAHSAGSSAGIPNFSSPNSGLAFNKLSRKLTSNSISSSQLQSHPQSMSQSQLSKQIKDRQTLRRLSKNSEPEGLQKFLISPESSDSEDQEPYYPGQSAVSDSSSNRRKSIISLALNELDNESLVSTSVADCIRQCTTEISGH